jgi:hypothetical protein
MLKDKIIKKSKLIKIAKAIRIAKKKKRMRIKLHEKKGKGNKIVKKNKL